MSGRRLKITLVRSIIGLSPKQEATVKALGMAQALGAIWETRQAGTMRAAVERGRRADRFGNLSFGLGAIVTVALTTVGAVAILDQALTIGALVAANLLAARVVAPFHQLVGNWRALVGYRQARARLEETLNLPEDREASSVQFGRPQGHVALEDDAVSAGDAGATPGPLSTLAGVAGGGHAAPGAGGVLARYVALQLAAFFDGPQEDGKQARAGRIKDFTGIDAPYEASTQAELTLKSAEQDAAELAATVIQYLEKTGKLAKARK